MEAPPPFSDALQGALFAAIENRRTVVDAQLADEALRTADALPTADALRTADALPTAEAQVKDDARPTAEDQVKDNARPTAEDQVEDNACRTAEADALKARHAPEQTLPSSVVKAGRPTTFVEAHMKSLADTKAVVLEEEDDEEEIPEPLVKAPSTKPDPPGAKAEDSEEKKEEKPAKKLAPVLLKTLDKTEDATAGKPPPPTPPRRLKTVKRTRTAPVRKAAAASSNSSKKIKPAPPAAKKPAKADTDSEDDEKMATDYMAFIAESSKEKVREFLKNELTVKGGKLRHFTHAELEAFLHKIGKKPGERPWVNRLAPQLEMAIQYGS